MGLEPLNIKPCSPHRRRRVLKHHLPIVSRLGFLGLGSDASRIYVIPLSVCFGLFLVSLITPRIGTFPRVVDAPIPQIILSRFAFRCLSPCLRVHFSPFGSTNRVLVLLVSARVVL